MATRRHAATTTKRRAIRTLEAQRSAKPVEDGNTTNRFRLMMRQGEWQPVGEVVFRRSWPSRLDAKQEAMDVLAEVMTGAGWVAAEDRSWLVLCLDEAVTNAMLHGNEGDPRLAIDVAVAIDGRRWQLAISDQGPGFSMASIPDPDNPASLLLEHGRGIRLMRAWLGSLTYWRRGATVVLSRRRADISRNHG
jgi:anti-sigma regulatory factor (Ser/Thr protein kinase)